MNYFCCKVSALIGAGSLLFTISQLSAANFYPINSVTTDMVSGNSGGNPLTNIIQGPGAGFGVAEPHAGPSATWYTNQAGADYINGRAGAEYLYFDLGADVYLTEISYWGYAATNANGLREFNLHFAKASDGAAGYGTSITANPNFAATQDPAPRQSFSFAPVTARYVRLTATSTFYNQTGAGAGGDRLGIGEIAFENAVPPADPLIDVDSTISLDLDGSVQTFFVPVGNSGATQSLVVSSVTPSGTNGSAFTVSGIPGAIAAGGTEMIQLSFDPTGLSGNISASLQIQSNDVTNPSVDVTLSGFIYDPNLIAVGSFPFALVPPGSAAQTASFDVTNGGGSLNLVISGTNVTGADASHFSVTSAPSSLTPQLTGQIVIEFDPAGEEGNFSAQLEISSNDPTSAVTTVNLSARVANFAESTVRINEFMASNSSTLNDGDGNTSDWIELYNEGPLAVDITGWHLTDDAGNLSKWMFPSRTLAAGEFLTVFASGQNTDDYVDGGGFLHTNFKLSASGEYLALVQADGSTIVSEFTPAYPGQFNDVSNGAFQSGGSVVDLIGASTPDMLVPADGTLGTTWLQSSFVPGAGWFSGTGQGIGYDNVPDYDPYITTDVETELKNQGNGIYIRLPFTVADAAAFSSMSLHVRYDDGIVLYLNGTEIASRNAPASPVWSSFAAGSHEATAAGETIDVSAYLGALNNGNNVLAIHGLNRTTNSSDFLADVELSGNQSGNGPVGYGFLVSATPGEVNSASAIPGPAIANVIHLPLQPTASESITVTAVVTPRLAPISSVDLIYRVDYGNETTVEMSSIGGDTYTATIPSGVYGAEDMVRWHVQATDTSANAGRAPAFLDSSGNNQTPEYFGTMVQSPAVNSDIPAFHWFTQNASASRTRTGARASLFFRGKFYDNIFVRARGNATNGSSQKFDFNKGFPADLSDEMTSVGEVNMNAQGADGTYVRQPLAFDSFREAGAPACLCFPVQMRLNGSLDRVGILIEQVDEDFLKRNGMDRDGALYKFVQRSNLRPGLNDTEVGTEKKIPDDDTDFSDLQALIGGLKQSLAGTNIENSGALIYSEPDRTSRHRFLFDNLNVAAVINYMAATILVQDTDDTRKNFYLYRDTFGTGEWEVLPWDKDFSFGIGESATGASKHPFWGDAQHKNPNANQWNVLFDAVNNDATMRAMLLRRLRTQMDDQYKTSSGAVGVYMEPRANEISTSINSVPGFSASVSSLLSEINERRQDLYFNLYGPGGSEPLIPAAQSPGLLLNFGGIEYNPSSGNQDEEYIEFLNPNNEDLDISGWTIEGGVTFTFPAGTVVPGNGEVYVSPSSADFRNRAASPTGGEGNFIVGPFSGHISNFSEVLTLKDAGGTVIDSTTTPYDPSDAQLYLVVSEIMYHQADPKSDAEFVELMNISSSVTLDLSSVAFTAGIDYVFPGGTSLAPGEKVVVSFADFQNGSRLNNGSDRIKLEDATGSTVKDFTYNDAAPWPVEADGGGPSLVLINPESNPDHDMGTNWRASASNGGNPGASDSIAYSGGDLVAYALSEGLGISVGNGGEIVVDYGERIGADESEVMLEVSADLVTWMPAIPAQQSAVHDGAGVMNITQTLPAPGEERLFVRLKVTLMP